MKVLLISANTETINMPTLPLGLASVAAATHTSLAKKAIEEGIIAPHDELLFPRFYLSKGLEDWLPKTLKSWAAARPHWMIPDYR